MPVEKQSLKKNTVSILIARIAAPASSLFLIICVARYLGVEELGKYSLILSFLLLFQILPTFGLNYYITREVSRDNSLAGRYLVDGMLFFIISGLFFSVVLNILAHFLSYPDDVKTGLFIVSFALVPSGLYVLYESLLMGLETMSYLSTVNLLEGLFRSLIGISGVMAGFGFYWLVWTLFLSKCISCLFLLFVLRNKFPGKIKLKVNTLKDLIRASKSFFGINLFAVLNSRIDFIILSVIAGMTNLGYYSASYRIIESTSLLSGAIVTASYPVLSRLFSQNKESLSGQFHKLLNLITLIFIPISISLFYYAEFIISLLFSDAYNEAVIILKIMSVFSLLAAFDQTLASITLSTNKQKQELCILGFSCCCYAALLITMVPLFGMVGAAISTVLAMLIQTNSRFVYIYKNIMTIKIFSAMSKPIMYMIMPLLCFYLIPTEIIGGSIGFFMFLFCFALFDERFEQQRGFLKGKLCENITHRS